MFRQLSYEERFYIQQRRRQKASIRSIARDLGRAPSTILREVRKGSCELLVTKGRKKTMYDAYYAQAETERRAQRKGPKGIKIGGDHESAAAIARLLTEDHCSPFAALVRAKREGELKTEICVNTLYSYIHTGVLGVGAEVLLRGSRRASVPFSARRGSPEGRTGGKSISERPKSVLSRSEFGHWEGDLVVSSRKGRAAVLTLIERKTREYLTVLLPDRKQESVRAALDEIERRWGPVFRMIFKSITWDNGVEFKDARSLSCSIFSSEGAGEVKRVGEMYYAHPYCSGERGSNENANGMLRRFFPKGTSFDEVGAEQLAKSTAWINAYPRAVLGGFCAQELFDEEVERLLASVPC